MTETYMNTYRRIVYCPMCEKIPPRPKNQDPLNPVVPIPKICLSCQAKNSALTAEVIAAGKVKVKKIPPGASALDTGESVFSPHRKKKWNAANRAKTRPP